MDIRYLAGFFDGEGTIRMKAGYIQIQIGQRDEAVLHLIKATYGGWLESGGATGVKRWVLRGKKAHVVCDQMLPYLIVKAEQVAALCAKI